MTSATLFAAGSCCARTRTRTLANRSTQTDTYTRKADTLTHTHRRTHARTHTHRRTHARTHTDARTHTHTHIKPVKHTVAHDKLWDEVDAPVSAATVLVFFIKLLAKVVVELAEGAHGCALAAVVVVAVHVQHLLAGHREQAGEHALLEACAKHNHIILLILSGKQALGQRIWL